MAFNAQTDTWTGTVADLKAQANNIGENDKIEITNTAGADVNVEDILSFKKPSGTITINNKINISGTVAKIKNSGGTKREPRGSVWL